MTRRIPVLASATLIAACASAVLAGCTSTGADVTGAAGTPLPVTSSPAVSARVGEVGAPAGSVPAAGAPPCVGFPSAGKSGLPCLGPGEPVDVAALPGPILVSVWASWCQPCRAELPILQRFHASGGPVLGVDVRDDAASAAALLDDLGVDFPSVADPESRTRVGLGWVGPPLNVIISDGVIVHRFDAPVTSVTQIEQGFAQAGLEVPRGR